MWIPTSGGAGARGYGSGALIFCSYILGVGVIIFVMTANQKFALLLTHLATTVERLLPQLGLSGLILLSGMTLLAITRVHGKITLTATDTEELHNHSHNAEILYKCRRLCSLIIYSVIGACFVLLIHAYVLEDGVSWITRAVVAAVNFVTLYAWLHYMHARVLVLERSMAALGGRRRRFREGTLVTSVGGIDHLQEPPHQVPLSMDSSTPSTATMVLMNEGFGVGLAAPTLAPPPYNEVVGWERSAESVTPPPCYQDAEIEIAKKEIAR